MITINILLQNSIDFYKHTAFIILLVVAAIQDIQTREIEDWVHILIAITSIINIEYNMLFSMIGGAIISAFPLFVASILKENSIGGADVKLMAASGLLLGIQKGITALIIGLFIAILVTTITRIIKHKEIKQSFPLVPYLAIGNIIALSL